MEISPVSTNLVEVQHHLKPYMKSRQEVLHIRRVIATYIEEQLDRKGAHQPRLLSSTITLEGIKSSEIPLKGYYGDYLQALQANVDARHKYDELRQQHMSKTSDTTPSITQKDYHIDDYLALVRRRQKLHRLLVLEGYFSTALADIAALAARAKEQSHIRLPQVPSSLITSYAQDSSDPSNMQSLVSKLEHAVLAVKRNLRKEKENLGRESESTASMPTSPTTRRLQALYATRDTLIGWIEDELSKSKEVELSDDPQDQESHNGLMLNRKIEHIRAQYGKYTAIREKLLNVMAPINVIPDVAELGDTAPIEVNHEHRMTAALPIAPLLSRFAIASTQQKSYTLQKSCLSTNVAARQKDLSQALDRLMSESHLLPTYPLPIRSKPVTNNRTTFSQDMSAVDPITRQVEAWTHASAASTMATKDIVLKNFEESSQAIDEADKLLHTVKRLTGHSDDGKRMALWSSIDGQVGVLGR